MGLPVLDCQKQFPFGSQDHGLFIAQKGAPVMVRPLPEKEKLPFLPSHELHPTT
jgi:hypothetical protein